MPNREHAVLGVHDPDTFRQGVQLTAEAHRRAGTVTAVAALTNIGAGHALPTSALLERGRDAPHAIGRAGYRSRPAGSS